MPKHKNVLKEFEKEHRKRELQKQNKTKPAKQKSNKKRVQNWQHEYSNWDEYDVDNNNFEKFHSKNSESKNTKKPISQVKDKLLVTTELVEGKVIEVTGNLVNVKTKDQTIRCHLRGSLKYELDNFVNAIIVGDNVQVKIQEDQGVVESILPRTSYLARPYMPDKGKAIEKQQLIAANVDQLLIVASWLQPNIWPELIDKYLIVAQRNHIDATICINKIDLSESKNEITKFIEPYKDLGYKIVLTSATNEIGIHELQKILSEKITVLAGLSGAGKSSLINKVIPGLNIAAKTVGQRGLNRNQGRHTTTTSTWYTLPDNGAVIDTPGIRQFALVGLKKSDLPQYYPEIQKHILRCKYNSCSHIQEDGCAVREARKEGLIPDLRYKNYLALLACLPN